MTEDISPVTSKDETFRLVCSYRCMLGFVFMYEHRKHKILSRRAFAQRVLRHSAVTFGIFLFSLLLGISGYHFLEKLSLLDSCLNASMILGGMGPVDPIRTAPGKLFASFYALFAGVIFLVGVGIILAPVAHRMLHKFHLDLDDGDEPAHNGKKEQKKPHA